MALVEFKQWEAQADLKVGGKWGLTVDFHNSLPVVLPEAGSVPLSMAPFLAVDTIPLSYLDSDNPTLNLLILA